MANSEHLVQLQQGVENWNEWRKKNSDIKPNLTGVNLSGANLIEVNLSGAFLGRVNLSKANLSNANLSKGNLFKADLSETNLNKANFSEANLFEADLFEADLRSANLSEANLSEAILIKTKLQGANLSGCTIYGISVWNANLTGATQSNLRITPNDEPPIEVDNLEVAQFVYLLLNNERIRQVIDTITSKVVLILGRFSPERKVILNSLRDELRKRNYTPVLFDFEKPTRRDLTETISTLAHMARFVIADITDAKSIPQELERIVPDLPSVAIQPLLLASQYEYSMFEHFRRYPWVLEPILYKDEKELLADIAEKVIAPAEKKVKEQIRT
jgi:Pentapeptide repeats (8 copies)